MSENIGTENDRLAEEFLIVNCMWNPQAHESCQRPTIVPPCRNGRKGRVWGGGWINYGLSSVSIAIPEMFRNIFRGRKKPEKKLRFDLDTLDSA